jgi:hypothetical protein
MKPSQFRTTADNAASAEKRRIFIELTAFRKNNGIGSFKLLSAATGGKIATHTISHMYMGTKVRDEVWQQVGKALETLRDQ